MSATPTTPIAPPSVDDATNPADMPPVLLFICLLCIALAWLVVSNMDYVDAVERENATLRQAVQTGQCQEVQP